MLWREVEEISLDSVITVAANIKVHTGIKFYIQENAPDGAVSYCIISEDCGTKQVLRSPSRDLTLVEAHVYLTGWLDAIRYLKGIKKGNTLPTPPPVDP